MREEGAGGGSGLDPREAEVGDPTGHLLAAKELHSQKGEHYNKEEKEEQQADDGFHGVEKRDDQVPERRPVPADRGGSGSAGEQKTGGQREARPTHRATCLTNPAPAGASKNPADLLCDFENTQ